MTLVFDPGTEKWIQFARQKSKELELRRLDLRLPRLVRTFIVDVATMIYILRTEFMELIRITGTLAEARFVWGKFVAHEGNFPTKGTYFSVNTPPAGGPLTKCVFLAPTGGIAKPELSLKTHAVAGDQIEWSKDNSTIVDLNHDTGVATIIRGDVNFTVSNVKSMQRLPVRVLSSYYKQEHAGMTDKGDFILLRSSDLVNAFFWIVWDDKAKVFNQTNIPLPEAATNVDPRFYLNPFTGDAYIQILSSNTPIGELGGSNFWKADILKGTLTRVSSLPAVTPLVAIPGPPVGTLVNSAETMVFEPTDKSAHVLTLQFEVTANDGASHITFANPKIFRDGEKYIEDATAGGLGTPEFGIGPDPSSTQNYGGGFTSLSGTLAILAVGDEGRILLGYFSDVNHLTPGNPISSLWKWGPDVLGQAPSIKTFSVGDFKDPDHLSKSGRNLIRYNTNSSAKSPVEMWRDGERVWTPNDKDDFVAGHILRLSGKTEGVFQCFDTNLETGDSLAPPNITMAQITKNKDDTWTLKKGQGVSSQFTALLAGFPNFFSGQEPRTRDLWVDRFSGGGLNDASRFGFTGGGGGGGGGGG